MIGDPLIMGILNISPDSFSDGRGIIDYEDLTRRAVDMIRHGASVIDVGAESTRPGATSLSADEDLDRLGPLLPALLEIAAHFKVRISVDTRHASTARYAIEHGVHILNDVSGGSNRDIWELLGSKISQDILYLGVHSLTIPANPHKIVRGDVVAEVVNWIYWMQERAKLFGFPPHCLLVDPGIGFGKNAEQSFQLLRSIPALREAGCPVVIGHSRKSCLSFDPNQEPYERDLETNVMTGFICQQEIAFIRVHNVLAARRSIELMKKVLGIHSESISSSSLNITYNLNK
jgi:dihydropteroate synthase